MYRVLLIFCMVAATTVSASEIRRKIANMFMIGFEGEKVTSSSEIVRDICREGLGGVILFDRHPVKRGKAKNIVSPSQLMRLTASLKKCRRNLLIAVDQEGGVVQRLKKSAGFEAGGIPGAAGVARRGKRAAAKYYGAMAHGLEKMGINYNLAPVADLALNPDNAVIVGWGRSYGKTPSIVADFDSIFIRRMHQRGILTSLKHFPGHGSSRGDTHDGFVDVTDQWTREELQPYRKLLRKGLVDSIMVAHLFNRHLDGLYPASLSRKTVEELLRKRMGYDGVVITDDLQMGAIAKRYSLRETIRLAINAGDDILLFGNQLDPKHTVTLRKLVDITLQLVRNGEIPVSRINESNRRIEAMKRRIGIHQTNIHSTIFPTSSAI